MKSLPEVTNYFMYAVRPNKKYSINRAPVYGLLFECPMKKEEHECPFTAIRILSPEERLKYIEKLSDKELRKLYRHHRKCLVLREQGKKVQNQIEHPEQNRVSVRVGLQKNRVKPALRSRSHSVER